MGTNQKTEIFWSTPTAELLGFLGTSEDGLTDDEANLRLIKQRGNIISAPRYSGDLRIFVSQFKSPIILILIFASLLSFFLHDAADALIILGIILFSGFLGFWQERGAAGTVNKLLKMVQTKTVVLRDGQEKEIAAGEVVRGDIVILSAGASIPADCFILIDKTDRLWGSHDLCTSRIWLPFVLADINCSKDSHIDRPIYECSF